MKKVYLRNKETKQVIMTIENVENYGTNFVEYKNNGYRAKMYCNEDEEFVEEIENEEEAS
jgi:hypothetical protein